MEVVNLIDIESSCLMHIHGHNLKVSVLNDASECDFSFDYCLNPLPSHRHNRSNDDCLEGKRKNYEVHFVQYCVQQFCTVQCTNIWTDLTVVCWLNLALMWLYCVLQITCVRFSFFGVIILCFVVYLCMCVSRCVRFCFFNTVQRDWLEEHFQNHHFGLCGT